MMNCSLEISQISRPKFNLETPVRQQATIIDEGNENLVLSVEESELVCGKGAVFFTVLGVYNKKLGSPNFSAKFYKLAVRMESLRRVEIKARYDSSCQ